MKKMNNGEVKKVAQVHTASMQQNQNSNPDTPPPESVLLTTTIQSQ